MEGYYIPNKKKIKFWMFFLQSHFNDQFDASWTKNVNCLKCFDWTSNRRECVWSNYFRSDTSPTIDRNLQKNLYQIITWADTSQWVNVVVFFLSFRKAGREISKVFHLTVEIINFKECSLFLFLLYYYNKVLH